MRPMSLFESGESNGSVSLKGLFNDNYVVNGYSKLSVEDLALAIARGGWPDSLDDTDLNASRSVSQYLKAIINSDISRVFDSDRINPETVRRIIESIARNTSTYASLETIRREASGEGETLSVNTLKDYLDAMQCIFLIENLPAWNPHLRSRTRLIKSHKWHFVDPSISMSALRASSKALISDFNTFGLLFESLCVRDLRIYSQPIEGTISYFRDINGNEVDLIVQLPGGEWGAIEVKLGGDHIEEGVRSLIKLRDNVDPERMKPPSFLMVLTAGQFAVRRPDGVLIVPIGCLRD
jgi:predicted AAA+ superfamily ATPase